MAKQLEVIGYRQQAKINVFLNRIWYRMPHFHNAFEVSVALEGSSEWVISGKRFVIEAGDIILLNPNQVHEIRSDSEGCLHLYIQFPVSFFSHSVSSMQQVLLETQVLRRSETQEYRNIFALAIEFASLFLGSMDDYPFLAMSIFHLWVERILDCADYHLMTLAEQQKMRSEIERIARLLHFVQENYTYNIKLADFAKAEGLSLSYTSRFIKQQINKTFQELVKEFRLIRAQEYMHKNTYSLTELSVMAGFSDPRYMKQAFEEKLHITPQEYQENIKKAPLVLGESDATYSVETPLATVDSIACLHKLRPSEECLVEIWKQLYHRAR